MTEYYEREVLQWHDLKSEEVYHIAHIEDDLRTEIARNLQKVVSSSIPLQSDGYEMAVQQMRDLEDTTQQWLNAKAHGRMMRAVRLPRSRIPRLFVNSNPTWLSDELNDLSDVPANFIAERADVSPGHLSHLRNQVKTPSNEIGYRVVCAIADIRGLAGDQRETYVRNGTSQLLRKAPVVYLAS